MTSIYTPKKKSSFKALANVLNPKPPEVKQSVELDPETGEVFYLHSEENSSCEVLLSRAGVQALPVSEEMEKSTQHQVSEWIAQASVGNLPRRPIFRIVPLVITGSNGVPIIINALIDETLQCFNKYTAKFLPTYEYKAQTFSYRYVHVHTL